MPPADGELLAGELPVVDEVLAAALRAQGTVGFGRWVCSGTRAGSWPAPGWSGRRRPRSRASAADALLSPPGAVGWKPAAKDLLAAVNTRPGPSAAAPPDAAFSRVRETAEVLRGQLTSPGTSTGRGRRGPPSH